MKHNKLVALLAFGALLGATACAPGGALQTGQEPPQSAAGSESKAAVYQKITPEQAREMMQGQEAYILLDVRTEEEFAQGHIEGALLLPDYEIAQKAEEELPDKEAVILLYCRSGRRSEAAARKLVELGYTNVYDFGGIIDWPYDTVETI